MLARDFDLVHISVGDMFRWHVQNRTKLGTKVQRYMKEGRLVPDEMVADVVKARLDIHDWRHGFVLDGFPRNAAQAEFFLETYDIDAVIAIDLPEEAAIARMQSRRLCSSCGLDYNLIQLRPKVVDVCDNCGGRLVTRADDTPEAIRARLRDYRDKTQPILDLLREKEMIVTRRRHAGARRGAGRDAAQAGADARAGRGESRPGAGRRRLKGSDLEVRRSRRPCATSRSDPGRTTSPS